MIEFQLDGGGFRTFGEDTSTTVEAKTVEKSDYEKQLERHISGTDDPDEKQQCNANATGNGLAASVRTPPIKALR